MTRPRARSPIDAFPGLGKTTSVLAFAKRVPPREIAERGEYTADGHERWPVCRVGLTGNTGMKDLNRAMLEFFGHPGRTRGTTAQFGQPRPGLRAVLRGPAAGLDDLHFLQWGQTNGIEVSNHLKWIANEFPVTLLHDRRRTGRHGPVQRGRHPTSDAVWPRPAAAPPGWACDPFTIEYRSRAAGNGGRCCWPSNSASCSADKHPGMLADDLSDYLFARSTGHIGSLMTLINRGCQRAVRTGTERLTATCSTG